MREIILRLVGKDGNGLVDSLFDDIGSSIRSIKARDIENRYNDFHIDLVNRLRRLEANIPSDSTLKSIWENFHRIVTETINLLLSMEGTGVSLQKIDEVYVYFRDLLNSLAYKKVISESDYSQMEKLEKEYREKLISLSLILMLPDSEIREIFGYEIGEYLINLKRDIPLLMALNRLDSRSLRNLLDILLKREDRNRKGEASR